MLSQSAITATVLTYLTETYIRCISSIQLHVFRRISFLFMQPRSTHLLHSGHGETQQNLHQFLLSYTNVAIMIFFDGNRDTRSNESGVSPCPHSIWRVRPWSGLMGLRWTHRGRYACVPHKTLDNVTLYSSRALTCLVLL